MTFEYFILLAIITAFLSALSSGFEAMFIALNIYDISKINMPSKKYKLVEFIVINKRIFIFIFLFLNTIWNVIFSISIFEIVKSFNIPDIVSGIISVTFITPFLFIFSEVLPKAIFRKYKEKIIIYTYPILLPFALIGKLIFRKKSEDVLSLENIISTIQNEFEYGEYSIITEILKNLSNIEDITVKEISIPINQVGVIQTDAKLPEIVENFGGRNYVIVVDKINPVGYITIEDILRLDDMSRFNVKNLLRKPSIIVYENTLLTKLIKDFNIDLKEIIFVINDMGLVVGIISYKEILNTMLNTITEIDRKEKTTKSFIAKGDDKLQTVLEKIGKNPEKLYQEYTWLKNINTLNGFIISINNFLPIAGERIKFEDITFEVLDVSGYKINRVRIHL
ncbi:MAG: CNNM domain-containing protein [Brevinematales bacterium]|nr:CNNM domain-containing protein [Brevinematales bacterium]